MVPFDVLDRHLDRLHSVVSPGGHRSDLVTIDPTVMLDVG